MECYINDKKKLYAAILELLENNDDITSEYDYQKISSNMKSDRVDGEREEMHDFLQIIKNISDNHHRERYFISKCKQILDHYKDKIKQTLSNFEIFQIFENNKIIVLFLLKSGIITISDEIYSKMMNKQELNDNNYCHFFYPELEKFVGEEAMKNVKNELLAINPNIFDDYEERRQEGENESYICSLIRQDSVEEFIAFLNRRNYSLNSKIQPSIFETNLFLINRKETTLIEYSAFFGSIQIFQYLLMNDVELTPSLWLFTIHSKNAELIHLLESNKVSPPQRMSYNSYNIDLRYHFHFPSNDGYFDCLIESIKCHHNDISKYIENNLLNQKENDTKIHKKEKISKCIKYHNYEFFQPDIINKYGFFYLCLYQHNKLVDLLIKKKEEEIKSKIIH